METRQLNTLLKLANNTYVRSQLEFGILLKIRI